MARPLIFLLFIFGIVAGIVWLVRRRRNRIDRRFRRRFKKMRSLILKAVDSAEQDRAAAVLADCEKFLDDSLDAWARLRELENMEADAREMFGTADVREHRERGEKRLRESIEALLRQMYQISTEVAFDWKQSLDRLEDYTRELEEQRRAFVTLDFAEHDEAVAERTR